MEYENSPLRTEPVSRLLLMFALPSVISMLVDSLYNMADQIFIGQGIGVLGIAATTVALPIVLLMLSLSTMLGTGSGIVVSTMLGNGQQKEAERTLANVFILALGLGVIVCLLGNLFLTPMLVLFGATAQALPYARQYTSVILLGAPFSMINISLSGIIRADGKPVLAMISFLAGVILNLILDPIFIFVCGWGVAGAALATILSQLFTTIVVLYYFLRQGNLRLRRQYFHLQPALFGKVLMFGISVGLIQIASAIFQAVLNIVMRRYGADLSAGADAALWAIGVTARVSNVVLSICVGIAVGIHPIIGYNTGAGLTGRALETYKRAVVLATGVSVVGWILCMLSPGAIGSAFGVTTPQLQELLTRCIRFFLFALFTAGYQVVTCNYMLACGYIKKALLLSVTRQVILGLPLLVILPRFFAFDGILLAGVISDLLSTIIIAGAARRMKLQ